MKRIRYRLLVCAIVATASVLLANSQALAAIESLWTYMPPEGKSDASIDASPAIADINGDGRLEVVVATTYGNVVALDRTGKPIWTTYVNDVMFLAPTAADLTGDGKPEILAGGRREKFVCLDGATGKLLWEWRHTGRLEWGTTAVAVADLDGDHVNEAVTGDANGVVVCLKGDGRELWRYAGKHGWTLCPALGDLDNDGKLEVMFGGTETPLTCLSDTGKLLWTLAGPGRGSSPVLADLNADGTLEILVGIGKELALVDTTGKVVWRRPLAGTIDAGVSVGDADQDGQPEIYVADMAGQFSKFTKDGELVWSRDLGARARRQASLGDIDGDGVVEVLVAGYNNAIQVFRPDGHLKSLVPLESSANGTPALVDLLGDGGLAIVCPAAYEGMKAFRWEGAPKGGKVLWPEYQANGLRTALCQASGKTDAVRIIAADYGAFHVGPNTFSVQIENPGKRALRIRLSVTQGSEEPCTAVLQTDKPAITHALPYTITGHGALDLAMACTVEFEGDRSKPVARVEHREHVIPFQRELMDVERALTRLGQALPALPDPVFIGERLDAFRFRLPGYRDRATKATVMNADELNTLGRDIGSLWSDSTTLDLQVQAIRKAGGDTVPRVLASAANPWAPFGGMAELVEGRMRAAAVAIEAFQGEHENAALNLFDFARDPISFRVEMGDLKCDTAPAKPPVPGKAVITLREAVEVPTQRADMSADAIPLLNEGNVFTVNGWAGRQLWLECDTATLAPGTWTGTLRLRSLDVNPAELTVPVALTIWNASLPAKQAATLCHWGYVHQSFLKDQPQEALADQVAHGTNVFVSTFAPKAAFDEQGRLVGDIDFAEHDAYVKQHAPHGIILFNCYQNALQGPGPIDGEAYRTAHVAWIKAWVKHLAEMGVDYDGFALYPVDEPGLQSGLVEEFLRCAKLAREADPRVQLYTDPVNRITMEELKAMAPYVDIWCPNVGSFLKADSPDKMAYMKSLKKTMWTYECAPNAKHLSPLGYYRGQAWLAWHHGITGIGFWSYCTSTDDPWFRPTTPLEYLIVYQGRGVVPSKRWKAIRDGLEDYSMLAALRDAADAAKRAGRSAESVAAAERLLNEEAFQVARTCGGDDILPGKEDPSQTRVLEDHRWETLQSIRREEARLFDTFLKP